MAIYQHDAVVPVKNSSTTKKKQVEQMFDDIAGKYDFLNRLLSIGIDVQWRKMAVKQLRYLRPQNVLDVATGTGDMVILIDKILKPTKITGIDISNGMLEIGRKKLKKSGLQHKAELVNGDSETINFPDNSFDAVTVAFGVRNFENLEKGLDEIRRVLKPEGKLIVLEFSKPKLPVIKFFYDFYLQKFTPGIGKLISKNCTAYQYLNDSVQKFPERESFTKILDNLGFLRTSYKTLSLGICTIYCGEK
jgi:demethylmenaquinone methyltransferase/2-methoxy-6-polyprenyl-1,4-benzoquinol methylase